MSFLVITVDTEADWYGLKENKTPSVEGMKFFQDICDKYNMIPTYLVTYEIATRDEYISVIKESLDKRQCEVGHHMHIWSTPPFENENSYGVDEKWINGIQSELEDNIFEKKMKSLHETISKNFGITPTSHRAGRWDIDDRSMRWLVMNNYLVDSSICPYISWRKVKGVYEYVKTDTYNAPNFPYNPEIGNIIKQGKDCYKILEVPVTGIRGDILGEIKISGIGKLRSILRRFGYNGTSSISFRPSFDLSLKDFEKKTNTLFAYDISLYNFMLHSSELTLGTSPYSRSESLFEKVKQRIEYVLKTAEQLDIKGLPLSEAAFYH